ncbi:alpha/beta hydrolase [Pontibacter sp. BT310]|uniref:Alpha/beta hydrolase n=2 Tax=Hymenobacteraceae TaxID=1853232 RepID=A0ABS6XBF8_9BACT|nr:alpha/beta hydrolase [Pontibacter sp. BT310]MBW3364989.1 alpha/beta hydrolase [Pontibacter populi]
MMAALFTTITACDPKKKNSSETESNKTTTTEDITQLEDTVSTSPQAIQPKGPKPDWAPASLTPQMQAVLETLDSLSAGKKLTDLTPQQARQAPTPTDAVKTLMQENNIPMPPSKVDTSGVQIPVSEGKQIYARIYTPKNGAGPFPVIVYYHGGGWVIANLDTYSASAQGLAEQVGAVVVSVAYRQAPENKFPTAHNDSYAAYEWVLKNAASIKGDPKRIAVAGESAGGNLAAAVSMMARDKKAQLPLHQLLVYPIADFSMNTPSYQANANAKPLSKPLMAWFFDKYLKSPADGKNPMISLVQANLKGMPPTTIITAEIDPLMSEGKTLADKLKADGVPVTYQNYKGVTHEFFGMATVVPEAKQAQQLAAAELKKGLDK